MSKQYTPLDNGPLGGLYRPIRTSMFQIVHLQIRVSGGQGQEYDSTTSTPTKPCRLSQMEATIGSTRFGVCFQLLGAKTRRLAAKHLWIRLWSSVFA